MHAFLFSLFTGLSPLVAASLSVALPQRRQAVSTVECSSSPPYEQGCWETLKVGDYVNKWWAAHGSICEQQERIFASCFIQYALGNNKAQGAYCNRFGQVGSLGYSACALVPSVTNGDLNKADFKDNSKTPQDAYVLYSIAGIWQWFHSIGDALSRMSLFDGMETISQLLESDKDQLVIDLDKFFSSMTAGILELELPSGTANLSSLVRKAPSTISIFATTYSSLESRNRSIVFDGTLLSIVNLLPRYSLQIEAALAAIQNNHSIFNTFTSGGVFIADASSMVAKTDFLLQNFYTWFTSYVLNLKHINIGVARNTDPYIFHKYAHDSAAKIDCDYYEAGGICSTWWYDNSTNTTYSFNADEAGQSAHNYYDAMKGLFANYTTGERLFVGADVCNNTGRQDGIYLNIATGTVDCVADSNLVSFNQTCADVGCEFDAGSPVSQADWSAHKCYPASYLGILRSIAGNFQPCTDKLLGTVDG